MAVGLAGLAVVISGVLIGVDHLPAQGLVARVAETVLLPKRYGEDWRWLVEQFGNEMTVSELREHVELAGLQRRWFFRDTDLEIYRRFVLWPVLGGGGSGPAESRGGPPRVTGQRPVVPGWRRTLWERFAPRVRKSHSAGEAVEIIVGHLRERVTPGLKPAGGIMSAWRQGNGSREEWAGLYLAAIRAVGIPARRNSGEGVEFWEEGQWMEAPRPMFDSEAPHSVAPPGKSEARLSLAPQAQEQ